MNNIIKNKKILITGGAGFIGSYVIEELLKHDPEIIIILDNLIRGKVENIESFIDNSKIKFVNGDIRDYEILSSCVSGCDYVFHMAALRINACAANPKEGFDVMMDSTFNLFELCVKFKIKKVIYSSSASIYGMANNFPTNEEENPYDNQTFYGAAKLWGEQALRSFKFMYDLDFVALRYFNVYGERMDTDGKYTEVLIKWLDCIKLNENPAIYGDGFDSMDFVHVKDVAKANVLALLSNATDEVFNVGTQKETNLIELLELLLIVNKSNLKPVFKDANTINPVKRRLADISKINNYFNFKPEIDLENGLISLSKWYFEKLKS